MVMAEDEGSETNKFKYQSYNEQLKDVHLPSAFSLTQDPSFEDGLTSQFHEALNHWTQLNLSPAFTAFAHRASPLCRSLPLLLHNWSDVWYSWKESLGTADNDAMKALLTVLQPFVSDLRTTLTPVSRDIVECLLHVLAQKTSADVLPCLLSAFSVVFNYILVPLLNDGSSLGLDIWTYTWMQSQVTTAKQSLEIQRAIAEVWGSALRRLRRDANKRCLHAMLSHHIARESVMEDMISWVFVHACKSVAQTLHTCAKTTISILLDFHLSVENTTAFDATKVLRRLYTALIHHCSNAERFLPAAEPLFEKLNNHVDGRAAVDEPLVVTRLLELLGTVCSVRKGSRLTYQQIAQVLGQVQKIDFTGAINEPLLNVITACLVSDTSDIALWLGAGRRALEGAWTSSSYFALTLTGALYEVNWGGFKKVALPIFQKNIHILLSSLDRAGILTLLRLLGSLNAANHLKETSLWKLAVQGWMETWLGNFELDEASILILHELLPLVPVVSSPRIKSHLLRIVEQSLTDPDGARHQHAETWINNAWVIGACLRKTDGQENVNGAEDGFECAEWVSTIIRHYYWCPYAMSGIVQFATLRREGFLSSEQDLEHLIDGLRSNSHSIRLSALQLLSSNSTVDEVTVNVCKKCLQAEAVPLTVQGVRERVFKIGQVPNVVSDDHGLALAVAIAWLLGQLKLNLRPVWSPAAKAIASLSQRFPEKVWEPVFQDIRSSYLHGTVLTKSIVVDPSWSHEVQAKPDEDVREEERSWRDPSAYGVRKSVHTWIGNETSKINVIKVQLASDRFDLDSYASQLLMVLGENTSLPERYGRDLIPVFMSLLESPTKGLRSKISNWFSLFSKFTNPKALYRSNDLRNVFQQYLAHSDRSLQRLALECLMTYKSPVLVRKSDMLRSLLDDTKWRDELAMLHIEQLEGAERDEMIPVLIRLFFGMILERRRHSRSADRRFAFLNALSACSGAELSILVDLMLEPFADIVWPSDVISRALNVPENQQVGFLTLLGQVLKALGTRVFDSWNRLIPVTLMLTAVAQKNLTLAKQRPTDGQREVNEEDEKGEEKGEDEDEDEDEEVEGSTDSGGSSSVWKNIRQLGIKRFTEFFRHVRPFDFEPYIRAAFKSILSPRLPAFDRENTQSPSAILDLFYVWSTSHATVFYLTDHDPQALPRIYDCLIVPSVKPVVISRIFDLIESIISLCDQDPEVLDRILKPHTSRLLAHLAVLVERNLSNTTIGNMGLRQITLLSQLAPYLDSVDQGLTLLRIFVSQLRRPNSVVPEKTKIDMLKIVRDITSLTPDLRTEHPTIYDALFNALARSFETLRSRTARSMLLQAYENTVLHDDDAASTIGLLADCNSFSTKRIEEPDFDRRLKAFSALNDVVYKTLSPRAWRPVLHNMLFFIQDDGELTIRNNASLSLKRFIDILSSTSTTGFHEEFSRILYPGLKRYLRSKLDSVQTEVLSVIAHAVASSSSTSTLNEMRILLAGGDDEASFFSNITHIQVHRRTRALRRLAEYCDENHFRSSTLADIFLPLVERIAFSGNSIDHNLANEAIRSLGHIAQKLSWGAYNSLLRRNLKILSDSKSAERSAVRALIAVLENFHFSMDEVQESNDGGPEDEEEGQDHAEEQPVAVKPRTENARIADVVNLKLLPTLLKSLDTRDELDDAVRIPLAIGIARIAQHLPSNLREAQLSRLLTILAQVFRSKSQDTRDIACETLNKIILLLGTPSLSIALRELRVALARGPHLHILAYVAHSILAYLTSPENVTRLGKLDEAVQDLVHVSAEVVLGQSGKDVQSEEFKTKMREVRGSSSKGLDTFGILAKFISPSSTAGLLQPLKAVMHETESLKVMQQVEEVLRRIAGGTNANTNFSPADVLALCHTLISQNAKFLSTAAPPRKTKEKHKKSKSDAIVQLSRKSAATRDHYAHNSYRFICFGLDLFNTAYRRSRFDFGDPKVISRLEPMVALIGNTLYSNQSAVVSSGLKAMANIAKCPLQAINRSMPVFVKQTLDIIRQSGTTESDLAQGALKALAVLLRDCSSAEVKEKDLVYLLEFISPDLEESSRQSTVFTLLRAIISRKFVVPEIYDLMDKVSEILVTNQSPQVRELCRGALLQFLLDYPQGKGRLKQQMAFLARNLSYVYEPGRLSVLELLSAVVAKFQDNLIQEYSEMLFVALVMMIANDESSKCREIASQLIKTLLGRLTEGQRKIVISHVHSWATQHGNVSLGRVSCQLYGLIVATLQADLQPYLKTLLEDVNAKIKHSAEELDAQSADDEVDDSQVSLEWRTVYQALTALSKVFVAFPSTLNDVDGIPWKSVQVLLLYPHSWVRTAACRLFGSLYAVNPAASPAPHLPGDSPLSDSALRATAASLCAQLKSPNLDNVLSLQIVKNLFYIGKCFYAQEYPDDAMIVDGEEQSDEETDGEGEEDGAARDKPAEDKRGSRSGLPWLFSRLSFQARQAYIVRRSTRSARENWSEQPTAVFKWFAAMTSHMDATVLQKYLVHILTPVYRITDDDTVQDKQMDELKILAIELQDLVQKKVGTTAFSNTYNQIRQKVLGVRRERKTARAVLGTTNPAAAAKRKIQKNAIKKESRKRKTREFTDHKIRTKFAKRRRQES